jgi:hypothetical protein
MTLTGLAGRANQPCVWVAEASRSSALARASSAWTCAREGDARETYSGISTRVECPKTLRLRVLHRLGYLPNVAVGVLEVGRSHAPGLIRRPLEEVDAPPGQIGMKGINIVGEGG